MKLKDRHFRLVNLLTMLDTSEMLITGIITQNDRDMLEAIERVRLECKIGELIEEVLENYEEPKNIIVNS